MRIVEDLLRYPIAERVRRYRRGTFRRGLQIALVDWLRYGNTLNGMRALGRAEMDLYMTEMLRL